MARSRAHVYSPFPHHFTPEGDGGGSVHRGTDNVSLRRSLAESQLGPGRYGARPTKSPPSPSLYSGTSLPVANAKSDGSQPDSGNSLFSGSSRPPSRSTATTPTGSYRSAMSQDGYSVRAFTRLGLREDGGWDSAEPFASAKFDARLVPLNPLSSRRGRSPSCRTVALGEGRSVRKASPAPSKNTVL